MPTETWAAVVDRHGAALIMLARQWTNCHSDAEDVVHEAFLRCWRNRESVREPAAYLYAAVRQTAMNWQRDRIRRRQREQAIAAETSLFQSCDDPATAAQRTERQAEIEAALTALPGEQREVLVMKIWGELTFAAIGEVLDVSPNTVAGRYRYALKALAGKVQNEDASHESPKGR